MDLKTTAREWRAIECIQTCIKTTLGLGKHLPISFSMQLDLDQQKSLLTQLSQLNVKTSLEYNYKEIGAEYEAIVDEEAKKMMITLSKAQI
jgi:hypothetical protein